MYEYIYIYIFIYTHIYVYIYTYLHIYKNPSIYTYTYSNRKICPLTQYLNVCKHIHIGSSKVEFRATACKSSTDGRTLFALKHARCVT